MNHCNLQQNVFMSRDDSVVCPKPRRVGILANNVIRPHRLHYSQSGGAEDVCDSKAGEDLLDIIRRKEESISFVSSPPFFLGSPPSRTANPLAQDALFGDEKFNLVSPSLSPLFSSASRVKGGGCGRLKFGPKPATVRVEGFDCLNRDCQNSSITAMA
ncbi:hypothetical protein V5N11_023419 [Cardamine amara subsp. amara]|uniref:Uncharacterized protein n=1 Tax=Cardamine amara subsp. amara TaxID=228776 RepID=A0ABD1AZ08_CARAN